LSETPIDSLYNDFKSLSIFLEERKEPSFELLVNNNSKKIILLAAASFFEFRFIDDLVSLLQEKSDKKKVIVTFVKNKALNRQFHTLFQWDQKNGANNFFGLFGDDFKKHIQMKIHQDEELEKSVQAFLNLGSERNRMVHENFGSFYLEKSDEEIYSLYKESMYFITQFPKILKEYMENE
jgi:hypothetical protein